ncbi:MAG: stage II sporulation protein R [Clostridia bacterium]|nr:stage II sporulation protein R [Clostridia bacterium]
MKNICISLIVCIIISLTAVAVCLDRREQKTNTEYLRIHIRADSNLEEAQAVKYLVKDEVVKFLTPYLAECNTKEKAEQTIKSLLDKITAVADRTLAKNGFNYTANAKLCEEKFPTRVYNELTLSAGYYDALIIELGSGRGDNWWCVVYPPLCFVGNGESYIYKSKIYDIINDFFKKA